MSGATRGRYAKTRKLKARNSSPHECVDPFQVQKVCKLFEFMTSHSSTSSRLACVLLSLVCGTEEAIEVGSSKQERRLPRIDGETRHQIAKTVLLNTASRKCETAPLRSSRGSGLARNTRKGVVVQGAWACGQAPHPIGRCLLRLSKS